MITKPIALVLNGVLEKTDTYLPLSQADTNRLLELIPEGESMYLTLQDNLYTEYILAENQCGTIVIHRGVDSEPRKFPKGTCLFFEVSLPLVKWLICNHNCCEGDCDCKEVVLEHTSMPTAIVGQPWEGRARFGGSRPFVFAFNLPDWVQAEYLDNMITFSGTPTESGTHVITVSATNCQGVYLLLESFTLTVLDE